MKVRLWVRMPYFGVTPRSTGADFTQEVSIRIRRCSELNRPRIRADTVELKVTPANHPSPRAVFDFSLDAWE